MLEIIFHFKMKRIKHQNIFSTNKNKPLFGTFHIFYHKLMCYLLFMLICVNKTYMKIMWNNENWKRVNDEKEKLYALQY